MYYYMQLLYLILKLNFQCCVMLRNILLYTVHVFVLFLLYIQMTHIHIL